MAEIKTDTEGNRWQLNSAGDGWEPAQENQPDALSMGLLQNFGQGATFGWGDEASAALSAGATSLFDGNAGTFGEEYDASLERLRDQQTQYADAYPALSMAAELSGGVMSSVATLGPALAAGGLGRAVAAGAIEGGIYGSGAADTGYGESRVGGGLKGAALGVGGGAVAQFGGKLLGRVLDKARSIKQRGADIAPDVATEKTLTDADILNQAGSANKRVLPSAQAAMDEGYDLSPGQIYGDKKILGVEDGLTRQAGGSPWLEDKLVKNQQLLNQKVGNTIGLRGATDLGEANMSAAYDNITGAMNKLTMQDGANRIFTVGSKYPKMVDEIGADYAKTYGRSNKVEKILEEARADYVLGKMDAKHLQETHSDIGARMFRSDDPAEQRAFGALREVMDDIMESNMKGESRAQWQTLRQQWGNLQTLIKPGVLSKEGMGNVSPFTLANKIRQNNPMGFVTGKPDVRMAELATIAKHGVKALKQATTSGTPEGIFNVQALRRPVQGLLNKGVAKAQEAPIRFAPKFITRNPVGAAGILGGFNAEVNRLDTGGE